MAAGESVKKICAPAFFPPLFEFGAEESFSSQNKVPKISRQKSLKKLVKTPKLHQFSILLNQFDEFYVISVFVYVLIELCVLTNFLGFVLTLARESVEKWTPVDCGLGLTHTHYTHKSQVHLHPDLTNFAGDQLIATFKVRFQPFLKPFWIILTSFPAKNQSFLVTLQLKLTKVTFWCIWSFLTDLFKTSVWN